MEMTEIPIIVISIGYFKEEGGYMKKIGLTITMIALAWGRCCQQQTYNHRAVQAQQQEEESQKHEEDMQQAQDKSVSQAYKTPYIANTA